MKKNNHIKDTGLPKALQSKYNSLYISGASVIVFGLFVGFAFGEGLLMSLFPSLIGLILIISAFLYRRRIVVKGYDEVSGSVVDYANMLSLLPKGNHPDAFLLETGNGVCFIPHASKGHSVPIGCSVKVYIPKDPDVYTDHQGYIHYSTVYGFDILG